MTRLAGSLSLALTMIACRPLPPLGGADAGMATLKTVTFERLHRDRLLMRLRAPSADLHIDGTWLSVQGPVGTLWQGSDGGVVTWTAATVEADLARGAYTLTDVRASDESGREATSPRVHVPADGGLLRADPPVRLSGPNFWLVGAGGATADERTGELTLLGPVEARAWPPDAGPPPR